MGALYMVLALAVMVPMAFLTEAVNSHWSSELQTSGVEIQNALLTVGFEGCNAILMTPLWPTSFGLGGCSSQSAPS